MTVIQRLRGLLPAVALVLALAANAAEEAPAAPTAADAEPEKPAASEPEPVAEEAVETETGPEKPEPEAAEVFVPTEDISEDFAVPFPVDI